MLLGQAVPAVVGAMVAAVAAAALELARPEETAVAVAQVSYALSRRPNLGFSTLGTTCS